jgi:hypothetical protein
MGFLSRFFFASCRFNFGLSPFRIETEGGEIEEETKWPFRANHGALTRI